MSRTTSVASGVRRLIPPAVPSGTIAAFATIEPSREFSVDTVGCACPKAQAVKYLRGPGGTTLMLKAKAWVVKGTPQVLVGIRNVRKLGPPGRLGGPNAPEVPCPAPVSATRHGVSG